MTPDPGTGGTKHVQPAAASCSGEGPPARPGPAVTPTTAIAPVRQSSTTARRTRSSLLAVDISYSFLWRVALDCAASATGGHPGKPDTSTEPRLETDVRLKDNQFVVI